MLERVEVLRTLSPEELEFLEKNMKIERFKKREAIFYEGEEARWFCVLLEGRVKISKSSDTGKEIILELIDPPDVFGAFAILKNIPYPAIATAMEGAVVGKIPAAKFLQVAKNHPELEREVLAWVVMRLRSGIDTLKTVVSDDVTKRLLSQLVRLAMRYGKKTKEGVLIDLKLTREDLAEMAGTTVETAIRVISSAKKRGILEERERKILIKNLEELSKIL